LRDQADKLSAKNLAVVGVSFDSVADNRAFAEKFDFPFPLLCDTDKKLGVPYGAGEPGKGGYAKRISYVIDEQGKVLLVYPKVDPSSHLDTILADLP
jgi:peroxiredoxin Q/BCP